MVALGYGPVARHRRAVISVPQTCKTFLFAKMFMLQYG